MKTKKDRVRLEFSGEWELAGKLPKDDKKRLAFYDKLFVEAYLGKIKLELIVLDSTYDQKLPKKEGGS